MSAVNFEDLKFFCMIVSKGSYIKASQFLNVPSPTLSRRIKYLENCMNVKLLHRTAHNISLTSEGEHLYDQVLPSINLIQENLNLIKDDNNSIEGNINLSAPSGIMNIFLNEWVVDFLKIWPDINIRVFKTLDSNQIELNQIDVAIKLEKTDLNNWMQLKIFSSEKWLIATPEYLKERSTLNSINELRKHDLICNESVPIWQFIVDSEIQNMTPNYKYMLPDIDHVLEATLMGLGISYIPKFLVEEEVNDGKLVMLLDQFTMTESNAYMIYSNKLLISKKVRTFVDFIKNKAKKLKNENN